MSAHANASQAGAISSISRPRAWLLGAVALLALAAWLGASGSAAAASCANAKYRTGPSLFLPECRAYELVTPQGKTNLLNVFNGSVNNAKMTDDGEGILYMTATGPLTEEASVGMPTWERAYRRAAGWKAESATPPVRAPFSELLNGYARWVIPSSSLDKILFTASTVYDPAQTFTGDTTKNGGVHLSDGVTDTWVSKPTWSGAEPAQGAPGAVLGNFTPLGGSPDLSTAYFNSFATLTPADGASGRAALQSMAVYKYENGQLSNAGVLPDGSLSPGGSISADRAGQGVGVFPSATDTDATRDNPVSRDGKSLLFLSPDPARAAVDPSLPKPQLYMAVDGRPSVLISAPQGDDEPVASTAGVAPTSDRMGTGSVPTSAYAVATPDHSVVMFSTKDALTEGAAAVSPEVVKTYRYETATGSLTYLSDLDRTTAGGNAKYGQIVELSEGGDSMVYVTEGDSLRLWRQGKPTLTISEGVQGGLLANVSYITSARFSDNEEVLALNSTGPLRGEPNHTPGAQPATYRLQVYRYTVTDDRLECISCKPGGSTTGAVLSSWGPENGYSKVGVTPTGNWSNRSMTADGSTVYFTTKTPLVEADRNAVDDVYQWHDGQLRLITTGASGEYPTQLYGTTPSGRDVFILSDERLSEADTDDLYDIYDVRIGGGFDPPQGPEAACAADECQGPPAPAPAAPSMGSSSLDGPGNGHAGRQAHRRATVLRASVPRSVKGTTATLRVRAPSAGRLVVRGRLLKKTARAVPRAGGYRLRVALTGAGKRKLRPGSSLRTRLRISFKPRSGAAARRTLRVTFKQPGAKGSRAANSGKGR